MTQDAIIEEIHKIRREYASKFNYNVAAICAEYREQEKQSKLKLVSRPPKPPLKQPHGLNQPT